MTKLELLTPTLTKSLSLMEEDVRLDSTEIPSHRGYSSAFKGAGKQKAQRMIDLHPILYCVLTSRMME